jgi:hypothetical protein
MERVRYGAVVERGAVVWEDIDAVQAPWWGLPFGAAG